MLSETGAISGKVLAHTKDIYPIQICPCLARYWPPLDISVQIYSSSSKGNGSIASIMRCIQVKVALK